MSLNRFVEQLRRRMNKYCKENEEWVYACKHEGCKSYSKLYASMDMKPTTPPKDTAETWEERFRRIYSNMRSRCNNPKSPTFRNYGGRGIKCEWNKYADFKKDMWESYQTAVSLYGERCTSIDRIDNDGSYFKENCRWADRATQSMNTRANHLITYQGKTQPLMKWAIELGISYRLIIDRITKLGWTFEEAIKYKTKTMRHIQKVYCCECGLKHYAKGVCKKHYLLYRKHGLL